MCVCLCVCERERESVCVLAVTHTICSIDDLHKPYFYYTWGHFFSHGTPVWLWPVICKFIVIQAGRPKRLSLLGHLFFNITNVFCAKKRVLGHTCNIYAPRWSLLASQFWSYVPPRKLIFPRPKKWKYPIENGMRTPTFEKKSQTQHVFFLLDCFCQKICHADVDSREQQAILLKKVETFSGQNLRFSCIFLAKKWHDLVTPFSTFAYIKGSLPTESTTPDQLRCRTRTDGEDFPGFWPILFSNMNIVKKSLFQKVRHLILIYTPK